MAPGPMCPEALRVALGFPGLKRLRLDLSKSQGYEITAGEGGLFGFPLGAGSGQPHVASEAHRSAPGSRGCFLIVKMTELVQVTQSPELCALTLVTTLSSQSGWWADEGGGGTGNRTLHSAPSFLGAIRPWASGPRLPSPRTQ